MTQEDIKKLRQLLAIVQKSRSFPWKWVEGDHAGQDFLEGTEIYLSRNYEDSQKHCQLIQEALRLLPDLLDAVDPPVKEMELRKLPEERHSMNDEIGEEEVTDIVQLQTSLLDVIRDRYPNLPSAIENRRIIFSSLFSAVFNLSEEIRCQKSAATMMRKLATELESGRFSHDTAGRPLQ